MMSGSATKPSATRRRPATGSNDVSWAGVSVRLRGPPSRSDRAGGRQTDRRSPDLVVGRAGDEQAAGRIGVQFAQVSPIGPRVGLVAPRSLGRQHRGERNTDAISRDPGQAFEAVRHDPEPYGLG
jgi:hypothetical protein